jgi:hypothetical protein
MIEIKKSEYKNISEELIQADIDQYTENLESWRISEGIPKPYANYWFVETIVENDEEWQLINDDQIIEQEPTHEEKIDINNTDYDYVYARTSEYGSLESQLEFITENGLEAWQAKVTEIKNKYPKPE